VKGLLYLYLLYKYIKEPVAVTAKSACVTMVALIVFFLRVFTACDLFVYQSAVAHSSTATATKRIKGISFQEEPSTWDCIHHST